jgi:FtsZ-interacting cell division protein ZipA
MENQYWLLILVVVTLLAIMALGAFSLWRTRRAQKRLHSNVNRDDRS